MATAWATEVQTTSGQSSNVFSNIMQGMLAQHAGRCSHARQPRQMVKWENSFFNSMRGMRAQHAGLLACRSARALAAQALARVGKLV